MILVHHLRVGRSVFTVWLLEEMGLEYDLKIYLRDENGRAQADLREAHPLGRSPVIEVDGMTIAESGAIAAYLMDRYDPEMKMGPPRSDSKAWVEWLQWLHFPEASAFGPLMMKLLLTREDPKSAVVKGFSDAEAALKLGFMEDTLGDKEFILGDKFQAPDVGVTYIANMAERLGEIGPYPKLEAYRKRNLARPAFVRAMERTGG